ncbi:MAG: VOC family protein [Streptosporangiales bacterium]|nr:VOC family protein [Streptosporangiales bacterium]MBO0891458.1 VOC family protein [Acidothermales bacterium]
MTTSVQITFDSPNPARTARFWAAVLGYVVQPPPPGFDSWPAALQSWGVPEDQWDSASALVDPDGAGPRVFIQKVPEPKTAKNRVHLDVNVGGGHEVPFDERKATVTKEVDRLVGLGATRLYENDQTYGYCVVMQDPDGNEFCLQ